MSARGDRCGSRRFPTRLLGLLTAVTLALAGCATPRAVPDERSDAWAELRPQLESLGRWTAVGRLVVRTGSDGNPANFTWIERADGTFQLQLAGPWGQGVARLSGGAGLARLVTGDGMRYIAGDARELLADVYGWDIAVAQLRRWLVGLPGPEAEYTLDRFGRLETLDWRDWHIEYGRYRLVEEGLDMPAVLTARRENGDTEVRIAVQSWRLGPADDSAPAPDSPVPLIGRTR